MGRTNAAMRDQAFLAEIKDTKARTILREWTNKYCALSDKVDVLTAQQKEIKDGFIEPLRAKLGYTKIDSDEWYIARRDGRPSLDKEKVKRYLFDNGVKMELILEAFQVATKGGQPYTEIKRRKQKGDGGAEETI